MAGRLTLEASGHHCLLLEFVWLPKSPFRQLAKLAATFPVNREGNMKT
jgi:hypothetical protein